jgi:hypothetical protein
LKPIGLRETVVVWLANMRLNVWNLRSFSPTRTLTPPWKFAHRCTP